MSQPDPHVEVQEVLLHSDEGRRLPLAGTYNFRDIGGYPTLDGGRTRFGKLFRADALGRLDDLGRQHLAEVGVRTVLDLREELEREGAPDAVQGLDVQNIHVPVFQNTLYTTESDGRPDASLDELYRLMLDHFGSSLTAAVRVLADAGAPPAVVHCSAGKDRTGVVVALVLAALGVSDEWIVADYVASERFLSGEFVSALEANFARAGIVQNISKTATATPPDLMLKTLGRIREEYGSVEGFLRAHGMTDDEFVTLRTNYVQPSEEIDGVPPAAAPPVL